MRILIVDDSLAARTIFAEMLAASPLLADCVIEQASNGFDALAKIKLRPPDVIVADVNMPEMDGLELLEVIRSEADLSSRRFGFLTADRSKSIRVKALRAGADFFLNKGCAARSLLSAILGGAFRPEIRQRDSAE